MSAELCGCVSVEWMCVSGCVLVDVCVVDVCEWMCVNGCV